LNTGNDALIDGAATADGVLRIAILGAVRVLIGARLKYRSAERRFDPP
jgi:hypothetical protein